MTQWEYMVVSIDYVNADSTKRLNELGQEGWELVAIRRCDCQHILKRPILSSGYREEA